MTLPALSSLCLLSVLSGCFAGDKDEDDTDDGDGTELTDGSDGSDGSDEEEAAYCELAENGWPDVELPDDYEEGRPRTGRYGEKMYVVEGAIDQNGNEVDFGQFYGNMIMISIGAEWCQPCHIAAESSQQLMDSVNERNDDFSFVITEWMLQNRAGAPAEEDVAMRWARDNDLEFPVLVGDSIRDAERSLGTRSLPSFVILNPHMEVVHIDAGYGGDVRLRDLVEDAFETFIDDNPDWAPSCPDRF